MEAAQQFEGNTALIDSLFTPKAQRSGAKLKLDEQYPYNEQYVNLQGEIRSIISNHFHENASYTDATGHGAARQYIAQLYGVQKSDVFLAPTVQQAHWYLLNLFLDDGDAVACNSGLKPDFLKVKTELKCKVNPLSELEDSKVIAIRYPDVDSDTLDSDILTFIKNLRSAEKTFKTPKAVVIEEPYSLYLDNNPAGLHQSLEMPEQTPVYLLTSINGLLLNEASGFAMVVLLNNQSKQFDKLNEGLASLAEFYSPPNTAFHPLISKILPLLSYKAAEKNYELLENRKSDLAKLMASKGIETEIPPRFVFTIGVKKTPELLRLIEKGEILLARTEHFRTDSDFVYISVLYSNSAINTFMSMLK